MKHLRIWLWLCAAVWLLCLCLAAAAEETRYIVYTNDTRLFSTAPQKDFLVVGADELARLQREGRVAFYEEDYEVELFETMPYDEPHYPDKWDLLMVNVEAAWRQNCLGDGVRIALIDSGVCAHPELEHNIAARACYLDGVSADEDNIGHGTFVAGLMAAEMNSDGIVGMAPHASIFSLKCFEEGSKTGVSEITRAIYDAVDVYDCKILNMSLGIGSDSRTLKTAVDYAVGKGCIIVAAVGNDGTEQLYYPAAYANVIGVGAVDAERAHASFSQCNNSVWTVAPGDRVISLYFAEGYALNSGTSFAAPIVSGAVALLLELAPDADATFFLDLFARCADDLGESGYDTSYGYGLLNVARCVNSLLQMPGDLDDDGQVTLLDVLRLLRGMLDRAEATSRGDLNGDGVISLVDIIRQMKLCV